MVPMDGGAIHTMHMDVMDAPDIRYSALSRLEDEHGGDESHADEHSSYDLDSFRLAVVGGVHPDGAPLGQEMPRWNLSGQDLVDLYEFLKTLP